MRKCSVDDIRQNSASLSFGIFRNQNPNDLNLSPLEWVKIMCKCANRRPIENLLFNGICNDCFMYYRLRDMHVLDQAQMLNMTIESLCRTFYWSLITIVMFTLYVTIYEILPVEICKRWLWPLECAEVKY